MVKRDALKQRLNAADQRRQRRQMAVPAPQVSTPRTATPDVVGLIVQAILQHADTLGSDARDVIVIAALNGSLRATTPSGDDARRLTQELNAISTASGVSMRAFRDALQQLLNTAQQNRDPLQGDAFLSYLSILATT